MCMMMSLALTLVKKSRVTTFDQSASTDVSPEGTYGANMDNVNFSIGGFPVVRKAMGVLNQDSQIQFHSTLSLKGRELAVTRKSHFNRDVDEMQYPHILSKKSYVGFVDWKTTDVIGTILLHKPIAFCPYSNWARSDPGSPPVIQTAVAQTYMDWLVGLHEFVYGNVHLHLKFIKPQFVAGSVKISALYGQFPANPTPAMTSQQYYHIFDLKEGLSEQDYIFESPCTAQLFRVTQNHWDNIAPGQLEEFFPGTWQIEVAAPLTVGMGMPTTIKILMYFSAPHLELYFQRPSQASTVVDPAPEASAPELDRDVQTVPSILEDPSAESGKGVGQSKPLAGPELDRAATLDTGIRLGFGTQTLPRNRCNLNRYSSLRDLFKRFYYMKRFTEEHDGTDAARVVIPARDIFLPGSTFATLGSAYLARRGGLRWKVMFTIDNASNAQTTTAAWFGMNRMVAWWPAYYAPPTNILEPSVVNSEMVFYDVMSANSNVSEVQSSFTTEYNYMLMPSMGVGNAEELSFENEGSLILRKLAGFPTGGFWTVHIAGSDDIRLGLMVGPVLADIAEQVLI